MHFKGKSSSLSKIACDFFSMRLSCFLIPCCPSSSPRTTLKENWCHAALPPNTHHLATANAAAAILLLLADCKFQFLWLRVLQKFWFTLYFPNIVAFLVQLLKKIALVSVMQKDLLWHAHTLHTQCNRQNPSADWLLFLALFYVKTH